MNTTKSKVWIITGPFQVGKTHFCSCLIEQAQSRQLKLAGVICPPVFENKLKTAITIEDIKSHVQKTLATKRTAETEGLLTDHWAFDEDVIEWGNSLLANTNNCDLLIVDELGPLEFNRGQGWQNGLQAIDAGEFKTAVVVVRPTLVETALKRWPTAQVLEIPAGLVFIKTKELIDTILQNTN